MRPSEHGFRTVSSYLHNVDKTATKLITPVSGIDGETWRPLSNGLIAHLHEILLIQRIQNEVATRRKTCCHASVH